MLSFPVPATTREKLIAHLRAAGGKGSGYHGHAGRPGEVGGSGVGIAGAKLVSAAHNEEHGIRVTQEARETHFLMPDGTRIGFASYKTHQSIAREVGTSLKALLDEGVARITPEDVGGFEIGQPLTEAQAQIIADDWNYTHKGQLIGDVAMMAPAGTEGVYEEFELPVTADAIRNWSRKVFSKQEPRAASILTNYLTTYGQPFTPATRPSYLPKGPDGQCYRNASLLVIDNPSLSYAEGYAQANGLRLAHAWAVTPDGTVIDPTWDPPADAYFGVRYDRDAYLRHLLDTRVYGVLGSTPEIALRTAETGGVALRVLFDPNQPRDEQGQWTDTGGGTSETKTGGGTWPISDDVLRQTGSQYPEVVAKSAEQWIEKLTPEEKTALEYFSINGYTRINAQLRTGADWGEGDTIAEINTSLANAPNAPPPDLVWRGIDGNVGPFVKEVSVGDELELDGLQSTTLSPRVASTYPMLLEIKPLRGGYLEPITKQGGEKEYLLQDKRRYRVVGMKRLRFDLGKGWLEDHEIKEYNTIQLEQLT